MKITGKDVQITAKLARIGLDTARIEQLRPDLERILDWVRELEEVNIDDIEPMTGPLPAQTVERTDNVIEGGQADMILANSPHSEDGFFVVPGIIE